MDKALRNAIMALPEMKERIKKLHAFSNEKFKIPGEKVTVSIRMTTKTLANGKEDETSKALNKKFTDLISKPL